MGYWRWFAINAIEYRLGYGDPKGIIGLCKSTNESMSRDKKNKRDFWAKRQEETGVWKFSGSGKGESGLSKVILMDFHWSFLFLNFNKYSIF